MNYETLRTKWAAGKRQIDGVLPDGRRVASRRDYSLISMGDLIKEYHAHLSLPRWRRGYDWDMAEKAMRGALNLVKVEIGF